MNVIKIEADGNLQETTKHGSYFASFTYFLISEF